MDGMDLLPIIAAAFLVAATFSARRLNDGAQPLRLAMAEKGEKLLADSRVSDELKDHIRFLLDHAFTMRTELVIAMFIVPFVVLSVLLKPSIFQDVAKEVRSLPPELRERVIEVMDLHDRITASNNPVLMFVVELEMALIARPFVLLANVIRGANLGFDARALRSVVERESDDLLHKAYARLAA